MSVITLTAIINQLLPEPHAGLLAGILFGTKAALSRPLYNALITTGTLHIVALSGTNITILTDLVNLTLLRFVSRRISSLLTVCIIIGFVWFVGPTPSIIRAAIMGSITLLAIIFGRQLWSLFSWILAVGIMLLLNPLWLFDLSFQLSALATLGIILFGKKKIAPDSGNQNLNSRLPVGKAENQYAKVGRFLWSLIEDNLHLTLAAQVFTVPLIFFQFHRISLVSPLSNVFIGWIIQPLTVLGMGTTALGLIWLPLGQVFAWVTWIPLHYILTVVDLTSKIPFASIVW